MNEPSQKKSPTNIIALVVVVLALIWIIRDRKSQFQTPDPAPPSAPVAEQPKVPEPPPVVRKPPSTFPREALGTLPNLPQAPLIGEEKFRSYIGSSMMAIVGVVKRPTKMMVDSDECPLDDGTLVGVVASRHQYYLVSLSFGCKSSSGKSYNEGYVRRDEVILKRGGL